LIPHTKVEPSTNLAAKDIPLLSFGADLLRLSPIDLIGLMICVSIFLFFPNGFWLKEKLFLASLGFPRARHVGYQINKA
jgi:hypothetical protein